MALRVCLPDYLIVIVGMDVFRIALSAFELVGYRQVRWVWGVGYGYCLSAVFFQPL